MNNPYFWIGEFGLLIAAIFSMGILQQNSEQNDRPPWYYFIAVWFVTIATVSALVEPISNPEARYRADAESIMFLFFGLERTAIFIRYRYKIGSVLPSLTIRRVNTYMIIVCTLILFWGGVWGGYQALSKKVDHIKDAAFSSDSLAIRAGQMYVVEARRLHRQDSTKIAQLEASNQRLIKDVQENQKFLRIQNESMSQLRMDNRRLMIELQKQAQLIRSQIRPMPMLRPRSSMLQDKDSDDWARLYDQEEGETNQH